jgi:excisionase family DNA binding protein
MFDVTDLLTLSEAANRAKVSRRTLQNHMKKKTAPPHQRLGREVIFHLDDVLAWKKKYYPQGTRKQKKHGAANGQ